MEVLTTGERCFKSEELVIARGSRLIEERRGKLASPNTPNGVKPVFIQTPSPPTVKALQIECKPLWAKGLEGPVMPPNRLIWITVSDDMGFMVEHKMMEKYDARNSPDFANSPNRISPGKKLYEAADPETKAKVDAHADALDRKYKKSGDC